VRAIYMLLCFCTDFHYKISLFSFQGEDLSLIIMTSCFCHFLAAQHTQTSNGHLITRVSGTAASALVRSCATCRAWEQRVCGLSVGRWRASEALKTKAPPSNVYRSINRFTDLLP
jgi:hypothetical protein